jgi:hypothetical protein
MNKELFETKLKELLSKNNLFDGAIVKIDYKHKKDKSKSHIREIKIKDKTR